MASECRVPPALIVALGGLLAVPAAFFQETFRGGVLCPFLVGPLLEEILKPIGVFYLASRRPEALRDRRHVVFLAVLAAVVFAAVENLLYMYVYQPGRGPGYVAYRWTVCVAVHIICSAIVGYGAGSIVEAMPGRKAHKKTLLEESLPEFAAEEKPFRPEHFLKYIVIAVVIHGLYNLVATTLEAAEVISF